MKKMFVLVPIFTLIAGCAFFQRKEQVLPLSPEDLKIKDAIGNTNSKIYGNYGKSHKGNFNKFTQTAYENSLEKLTSAKAKNMQDLYIIFKTKEFSSTKKTYIFCGFSERLGLAFCDDAACPGTEFFERTSSADVLATWKAQLPVKSCSKK